MSDTPRTDAAMMLASDADGAGEVCDLCAELERENAKLRGALDFLKNEICDDELVFHGVINAALSK